MASNPQLHAATHWICDSKSAVGEGSGKRPFNEDYLAIMRHVGMKPRRTEVGAKEQNGDVEASDGALQRDLNQALLVRGRRDFESGAAWPSFVDERRRKANCPVLSLYALRHLFSTLLTEGHAHDAAHTRLMRHRPKDTKTRNYSAKLAPFLAKEIDSMAFDTPADAPSFGESPSPLSVVTSVVTEEASEGE